MFSGLLYLLPALLLLGLLLRGRYVGERQLERLRGMLRRRGRETRPARSAGAARPRAARLLPRGGLLIAAALAVRPPPVVAAAR